jgi:hypothetical protein
MEELLWTTDELLTGDELDSDEASLEEDSFEDEELFPIELDEASRLYESSDDSTSLPLVESSPEQAANKAKIATDKYFLSVRIYGAPIT